MIEYFVDVAKECINIGNFNSLMAIIGKLFRLLVDDLVWPVWRMVKCFNIMFVKFLDFNNLVSTFVFGNIYRRPLDWTEE